MDAAASAPINKLWRATLLALLPTAGWGGGKRLRLHQHRGRPLTWWRRRLGGPRVASVRLTLEGVAGLAAADADEDGERRQWV